MRIVNDVKAEDASATRSLAQGDGVKQDEIIAVSQDSLGELRLLDETKLALGPGARMKLDKFVYDADKATGTIAVDLTKGAFRFITGVAKKPSYLIRSPSASISVRGTIFDVYVEANGTMWVLLHEGSIEICNSQGVCRTVNNPCGIVRVGAGGDLSDAATWNLQPSVREIDFETAFPFVVRPPQIDPAPRYTRVNVETGSCIGDRIPTPDVPRRAEAPQTPAPAAPGGAAFAPAAPAGPPPVAAATPSPPPPAAPESEPEPTEVYSPPPSGLSVVDAARRWTGTYVGVHVSHAWGYGDTPTACDDPFGIVDTVVADCALSFASGGLERRYDLDPSGWLGGVQVGYNFQSGNMVTGLELDISGGSVDGDDSGSGNLFNGSPGTRFVTQDLEVFGTLRARLGVVTNQNLLLYATAGLAYGRSEFHYEADYPTDDAIVDQTDTRWQIGWTVGAGGELMVGDWSLKAEYLYYDLGEQDLRGRLYFSGVPAPTFFEPEFETRGHIARIGINYHLD